MASQATQACGTMGPCLRRSWYARFMHTVESNDLRDSYPGRSYPPFALAVLRQGKGTER